MRKSPAAAISGVEDRSAELSSNESTDFTTELVRFKTRFRLGQHTYDRLGPGRPDEHTPCSLQRLVHALELLQDVAIAHRCRDDSDSVLPHQPVEAEVRHHGDRDEIDPEVDREHGEDLVAVDRLAVGVARE